ncbi:MAG: hypothetical protein KDC52_05625, partial [Ignavibacteriae bacterium]|nr:hypothetical protein [Ignavibacteriota bacterium]
LFGRTAYPQRRYILSKINIYMKIIDVLVYLFLISNLIIAQIDYRTLNNVSDSFKQKKLLFRSFFQKDYN